MLKAKLLGATAGAEAALAIEDVFSTYLYTGNGTARTITNGIDLAGEGGLVWIKLRSTSTAFSFPHALFDTERGALQHLRTSTTNASSNYNNSLTSFNSDGFSLGTDPSTGLVNYGTGTNTYASWTFRQAPRFFDVVTYTGTGANRTIAHDLGVVPGCIIVKRRDTTGDWQVYHRSLANTEYLVLNSTAAKATGATRWNSTTPTSSVFSLGTDATVNASGGTYVAYLFAHDPLGPSGDGSDGLIACGETGGAATLGWEPQWILHKSSNFSNDWSILDVQRGMPWGQQAQELEPNTSDAEALSSDDLNSQNYSPKINPDGFNLGDIVGNHIYIAIRRGPMREPTVGTQVFGLSARTGTGANATVTGGQTADAFLVKNRGSAVENIFPSRMTGRGCLVTSSIAAEVAAGTTILQANPWDVMDGVKVGTSSTITNASGNTFINYLFRRAPGFFDVVAYTGDNASSRQIPHNLKVVPEFIILKQRSGGSQWFCWHTNYTGPGLYLNGNTLWPSDSQIIQQSGHTDSTFGVLNNYSMNASGQTYIVYLFASLPGISKVGSYTGNGSSQTINCGFTTGARFILIKRTNSTGDWYVWDTARGIVSGNDPRLSLNTTAAEVTSDDTIDPDSTGFIVNQVSATNVNVNAATYIYLAIA